MNTDLEFQDILKYATIRLSDRQLSIWLAGCYGIFSAWAEEKITDTSGIKERFMQEIEEVNNKYRF